MNLQFTVAPQGGPINTVKMLHCFLFPRKIMDSGELDFYQHTKVCSNTCRSTKIDLVGTKVSVSCDQSADLLSASASSADRKSPSLDHQSVVT